MTSALALYGVWKGYPDLTGTPRTLRAVVARRVPALRGRSAPRRWALRDVSIELAQGRSLGLVGHNGAGKSTLLRLASGLGRPTRGRIAAHPDTASVLSLGTSFDPELTGRENAFTAALVDGLTRREATAALPAMLEFSELEEFVDSPVRTYSDGMRLRLAFGVVARLEPRLLVLDEVLAVGDLAFREKCREHIERLRDAGTSVLLASHAAEEIAATCDEALWLHRGGVRALGDAETVLAEYERATHEAMVGRTPVGAGRDDEPLTLGENRFGTQEVTIDAVALAGADGPSGELVLRTGEPLRLALAISAADAPVDDPILSVAVRRRGGDEPLLDLSSRDAGFSLGRAVRAARAELVVERVDLPAGDYTVDVGVYAHDWERAYDLHVAAYPLRMHGASGGKGVLLPPCRWSRAD